MAEIFQTTFSILFSLIEYINYEHNFTGAASQGSNQALVQVIA